MLVDFVTVTQGEDQSITCYLKDGEGKPLDITGATEIVATFKNADATLEEVKLTEGDVAVLSAEAGKIRIDLSDTITAGLLVKERQDFLITLTISGAIKSKRVRKALTVESESL